MCPSKLMLPDYCGKQCSEERPAKGKGQEGSKDFFWNMQSAPFPVS